MAFYDRALGSLGLDSHSADRTPLSRPRAARLSERISRIEQLLASNLLGDAGLPGKPWHDEIYHPRSTTSGFSAKVTLPS